MKNTHKEPFDAIQSQGNTPNAMNRKINESDIGAFCGTIKCQIVHL